MERGISVIGLFVMIAICWALSNNRKLFNYRAVLGGLTLQLILAVLILKTSLGQSVFEAARVAIEKLIGFSDQGAVFLFGENFKEHFFAFKVLPTIIFVSSISALLFYWGILPKIVEVCARIMAKVMGVSGSESLCAAANIFSGQTEAPLLIRPYLKTMTTSEIFCMMSGGMATVAGGVMAAYVGMGISAGHLLAASLMSAPAAILCAKVMYPETQSSPTMGHVKVKLDKTDVNAFDAACRGAGEGLFLALNVGAMLLAFIALVALVNYLLAKVGAMLGVRVTMEIILGYMFAPLAFVMGVPWDDCLQVGRLLGERTVVNEFLAYVHLGDLQKAGQISERAAAITTYALCGFANFSSIAIQIGGIGNLEPSRKKDFAKCGLKAMIAGTLASFMTACMAGIFI